MKIANENKYKGVERKEKSLLVNFSNLVLKQISTISLGSGDFLFG